MDRCHRIGQTKPVHVHRLSTAQSVENSLRQLRNDYVRNLDHIFSLEPLKITSPSTDSEIALALRVLEGCCLLHPGSPVFAHKFKAIKVLMDILSTKGDVEQGACLDALISVMLDSTANQMDFEACHGIDTIAELIKDRDVHENIRLKCGEFLLLFIGHLNGRERSPMMRVHEDIKSLLVERFASVVWAASQFGSTLDAEQRQTTLHIQARRVIESLDLRASFMQIRILKRAFSKLKLKHVVIGKGQFQQEKNKSNSLDIEEEEDLLALL